MVSHVKSARAVKLVGGRQVPRRGRSRAYRHPIIPHASNYGHLEGSSETGECAPRRTIFSLIGHPIDTAFHACNSEEACDSKMDELSRNAPHYTRPFICFRLVSDLSMPLTKAALLITNVFDVSSVRIKSSSFMKQPCLFRASHLLAVFISLKRAFQLHFFMRKVMNCALTSPFAPHLSHSR